MKKWLARLLLLLIGIIGVAVLIGWLSGPAVMIYGALLGGNPMAFVAGALLAIFALWRLGVLRNARDLLLRLTRLVPTVEQLYLKLILTIIAVAMCAITAKLYLPAANRIGPHLGAPTRADFLNLAKSDAKSRAVEAARLKMDEPLAWSDGGNLDVDVVSQIGSLDVHVDNP